MGMTIAKAYLSFLGEKKLSNENYMTAIKVLR
jgi:hypothetical protein